MAERGKIKLRNYNATLRGVPLMEFDSVGYNSTPISKTRFLAGDF